MVNKQSILVKGMILAKFLVVCGKEERKNKLEILHHDRFTAVELAAFARPVK